MLSCSGSTTARVTGLLTSAVLLGTALGAGPAAAAPGSAAVAASAAAATNHAPVAAADKAKVTVGKSVTIKVLANDTDPDGDPVHLVRVGRPSAGTATVTGSTIRYKAGSKAGRESFSYIIGDGRGKRAKGVVTITVAAKPKPKNPSKKSVEAALKRLGLPVGKANGVYDAATRRAVCAWRTIVGEDADRALPSASEARRIVDLKKLPKARKSMVAGVNVSITCQAAFWVTKKGTYKRVMAACTGKSGYRTRLGTFTVFRSFTTWRYSTLYPEALMYKPMQFSGGQAMHGSARDSLVKTYPASHGCVRMLHKDMDAMHRGGLGLGTKVKVFGHW